MLVALVKFLLIVVLTLCRENDTLEKHTNIYMFLYSGRGTKVFQIYTYFLLLGMNQSNLHN